MARWTHRSNQPWSESDVLCKGGLVDAIGIASRRMHKLAQLFSNDVCVCNVSTVGLRLFCGLELHQQALMAGLLLVSQEHDVAFCTSAGLSAFGRH